MKTKRTPSRPARPASPERTPSRPARPAKTKGTQSRPGRSASPERTPSRPTRAAKTKRTQSRPTRAAKPKRGTAQRTARTRSSPSPSSRRRAAGTSTPAASRRRAAGTSTAATSRWLAFVQEHGVVLASARGPVPSIAAAVAGEPIVGSWWAHPKGKAIFAALSELDDSDDVRCFKLVDGKVTFVHRRMWPALARLASDGVLAANRVACIQQEHMPTGEHRNLITPFPDWVPDDVARAAIALTVDDARAQLGAWV